MSEVRKVSQSRLGGSRPARIPGTLPAAPKTPVLGPSAPRPAGPVDTVTLSSTAREASGNARSASLSGSLEDAWGAAPEAPAAPSTPTASAKAPTRAPQAASPAPRVAAPHARLSGPEYLAELEKHTKLPAARPVAPAPTPAAAGAGAAASSTTSGARAAGLLWSGVKAAGTLAGGALTVVEGSDAILALANGNEVKATESGLNATAGLMAFGGGAVAVAGGTYGATRFLCQVTGADQKVTQSFDATFNSSINAGYEGDELRRFMRAKQFAHSSDLAGLINDDSRATAEAVIGLQTLMAQTEVPRTREICRSTLQEIRILRGADRASLTRAQK